MRRAEWVVVAVLALPLAGCSNEESSTGPVIAMAPSERDRSYPLAEVEGLLDLEDDCLTIDGRPVFWPAGTGWDGGHQAVTFAGDFEGAGSWAVGHLVSGGGGLVPLSELHASDGFMSQTDVGRLRACAVRMGVENSALLVLPPWPGAEVDRSAGE